MMEADLYQKGEVIVSNEETFKIESGLPLPKQRNVRKPHPFRVACESMEIGDCITIEKCSTKSVRRINKHKKPTVYITPDTKYRSIAVDVWKSEGCTCAQRVFYDNDGDMGLMVWKVKQSGGKK